MRYVLLIYANENEDFRTPEELRSTLQRYSALTRDMCEAGVFLGGDGLEPTRRARTVRVRGGRSGSVDGPFAETKEQLGGFYLIEA